MDDEGEGAIARSARISQFDKALMGLRTLVMSGEFAAGARLSEVALAERLEISRTPLRQAMARLVDEGLLERGETGGCRVVCFTMDDIVDAIEIRGVIEGTAARLAAERGMAEDKRAAVLEVLDELDESVARAATFDFDRYVQFNSRFHTLLGSLAGSAVVAREVERVSRLPVASPSAFLQGQELIPDFRDSLWLAQTHHRAIVEAIENREGTRAEGLAREHARLARKNLDFVVTAKPNLIDRVPGLALVAT